MATAVEDAYALAWNTPASLDVTANDTATNGTATITIEAAPKHGTATITGNKVSYTPSPGFFGDDSFTYKLSVGSASQTAAVKLKLEATMTLQGAITGVQIPGAGIQAQVGSKIVTGTADDSGKFSLTFKTNEPTDFVKLTAKGAGARSSVVLSSLVGEAGSLGMASTDGKVTADRDPSLNISPLSAVRAAFAAESAASAPATNAALATALQSLSVGGTLDRAIALQMVVNGGLALPAGMADTQALLDSPNALLALVNTLQVQRADALDAMRQDMIADYALSSAPPVPSAGGAPVTLLYGTGPDSGSRLAHVLTLRADGSGSDVSERVRTLTWKLSGPAIVVTYDQPISTLYDAFEPTSLGEKFIDLHEPSRLDIQGVRLSELAANPRGDRVLAVTTFGTVTPVVSRETPRPTALPRDVSGGEVMQRHVPTESFKAEDFAAGTKLAGVSAAIAADADGYVESHQDVATFNAGNTLTLSRTGQTGTWKVVDGKLRVDLPDASHLYTLLGKLPSGESRWLLQVLDAQGVPTLAVEVGVISVAPPMLDAAFWTHTWRSNSAISWFNNNWFELRGDGQARSTMGVYWSSTIRYWRQLSDGRIEVSTPSDAQCVVYVAGGAPGPVPCTLRRQFFWQPVARMGNTVWVLQQGNIDLMQDGAGGTRWSLMSLTIN